jgi:hypothetical protein
VRQIAARLARTLGIEHPGEGRIVLWAGATFFLVHSAAVALTNVSDTFFLKRIGVNLLPAAFLVSSLLLVATTAAVTRIAARSAPLPLLTRALIAMALGLVPLWLLVLTEVRAVYPLLIAISKQVESIAVLIFWVALGGLLHARQAKRLYAPIIAGGTLGEIAGSFASGAVAQRFGVPALLPAASATLLLAAFLAARATAVAPRRLTEPPRSLPEGVRRSALRMFGPIWRESRLFRILAVSALLCGILGPMLYFQFSYVADLATRGPDGELQLLRLYAAYRGWLNVAVLALQLVGTSRLFHRIGVPLAATLSPLVYLLGFFSISARLGLGAALAAMAGASLQDHAIYDPAQQVMLTLFPERLRPAATTLLAGPIRRGGGALGNVLILVTISFAAPAWVAAVGVPIAGLWFAVTLQLWRIYPSLLLEVASSRLFRHRDEATAPGLVDAGTLRVIEAALSAPDEHRARAACALVLEAPPRGAAGALARATRRAPIERRGMLLETLHSVLDRHGAAPAAPAMVRELEALLAEPDGADGLTRALLIEAYARLAPDLRPGSPGAQLLERFSNDPSEPVRLAAAVRLQSAAPAVESGPVLDATLASALTSADPDSRRIAVEELRTLLLAAPPADDGHQRAAAARRQWAARLVLVADHLADPVDRARAAEVLADVAVRHGAPVAAIDDRLVDYLGDPEPRVRIAALRFIGSTDLEAPLRQVVDHLAADDRAEAAAAAAAVRGMGTAATHALLAGLLHGRRATRDAALPLLRELHLDPAALRSLIDRELRRIERLALQRYGLSTGTMSDLVLLRLCERIDDSAHTVLLLLAALRDDDRLAALARLLARSRHGRARIVLLEALETLLPAAERDRLPALLADDVAGAAAAAASGERSALPTFDAALRDVLDDRDALTLAFLRAWREPPQTAGQPGGPVAPGPNARRDTSDASGTLAAATDLQHSERQNGQPREPDVLRQVERVLQLRSVGLFAGLTTRQLTDLAAVMREERFQPDSTIVREGEFGDCMYVVVSGGVRITRAGDYVGRAGAGEFFGEMSLFDGETRSATATASSDVHVLTLERHDLLQLMDEQPSIAIAMCQTLARRVRESMHRATGHASPPGRGSE